MIRYPIKKNSIFKAFWPVIFCLQEINSVIGYRIVIRRTSESIRILALRSCGRAFTLGSERRLSLDERARPCRRQRPWRLSGGEKSPLPKACIFCHSGRGRARARESVSEFRSYARVVQWWCAAQDSPEVSTHRRDVSIIRVIKEKTFSARAVREREMKLRARRTCLLYWGERRKEREREGKKNKRREREIETGANARRVAVRIGGVRVPK